MSSVTLKELRPALEGVFPAVIATASPDGTPNVTYLSKVWYLDDRHVGLSNQFFSKTIANVAKNPKIQLLLMHPADMRHFRVDAEYVRSEYAGEHFDRMSAEIDALASLFRMERVFRLRAVDVCRVLRAEVVASSADG
ncbi:MAG TPA: pyridoxamine 5'-phosphate oxidase family protein [Polyangiaceae bacterium]|nr:pyridoxamine 5'-phosphate oxidase family protein [Polyangiaceae bacterium]